MRTTRNVRPLAAGALLAALALAGCSSDRATGPAGAGLTDAEAQDMAAVVTTDADAVMDASTLAPASGVAVSAAAPPRTPPWGPPPCTVNRSPDPPVDSDGDPVADSVRFDFTGCHFGRGGITVTISGFIDVLDPTPTTTDFGIRSVFTDYRIERQAGRSDRTFTTLFNGARQVTGDGDQLHHLITNFTTDYTFWNGRQTSHVKNWNATFTADVPGSIQPDQPPPAGTLNIAGSSSWSEGDRSWSVGITTSGLHFDPTCAVAPRFDAGTVTLVIMRGGVTTTVAVEHTACGQYVVTRTHG